ncbi:hypothetical protein HZC31_03450 [Candidatus Woesearchaeota archaeon]|nr:hypothetical protein [Candidatus Woesearchaeota archaeon]
MTNRKKRLKKGIESLEKQIDLHEQKLHKAEKESNFELAGYYKKEILSKKQDAEEKKRLLEKGG